MPVCVEKMRQNKELELSSASMEVEKALSRVRKSGLPGFARKLCENKGI
jgi:hypothetical protein